MDPWVLGLVNFSIVGAVGFLSFKLGRRTGRDRERERVLGLLDAALRDRWSGSVRRVMNAVQEGREALLTEDEFFGPEPPKPKGKERPIFTRGMRVIVAVTPSVAEKFRGRICRVRDGNVLAIQGENPFHFAATVEAEDDFSETTIVPLTFLTPLWENSY